MKDAYSFHTSMEDLENYYDICYKAYERIFERAGIPEVVTVASDSGMMGGSNSHEDRLAICDLTLVETPNEKTIEEVSSFLKVPMENTCKAVVYQKNLNDEYVIAFTRGDMEVNEAKLTKLVGEALHPAIITIESGIVAGFIGPHIFDGLATLLFDLSLDGISNLVIGANKEGYHYTGFNMERDYEKVIYHDFTKITENGICPECGNHSISIKKGIEVGNIFQLGTKYSKAMGMQYLDSNGELEYPIMGCYGIGVGRLAASVCEAHHDDYGPYGQCQ